MRSDITHHDFDFADLYAPQTILLRLGSMGFLAVLNDSCAVTCILEPMLARLGHELSEIQFRELFAELAFVNLHLKVRPVYQSSIYEKGPRRIVAQLPASCELAELDMAARGTLMSYLLRDMLPSIESLCGDRDRFLRELDEGLRTFLFDSDGHFISTSAVPLPSLKQAASVPVGN